MSEIGIHPAHIEHAQLQAKGASAQKQQQAKATLERLQGECDALNARIQAMEKRVPLKAIQDPDTIVHHETERKTLTQLIKVVAYRSESCLARMVEPFFARHDDEIRAFLKAVFQLPGDIIPDYERHELRVRLYAMANNRSQRALIALCDHLNVQQIPYPGADLRLVYEAIQSH